MDHHRHGQRNLDDVSFSARFSAHFALSLSNVLCKMGWSLPMQPMSLQAMETSLHLLQRKTSRRKSQPAKALPPVVPEFLSVFTQPVELPLPP
eukprot:2640214-Amphidinium_carterae.1